MMIHLLHAAFVYQAPDGEVEALRDVSLDVEEGEFCSIVGPSGCGKSTLRAALAGLEPLTGGEIAVDGEAVRGPSPRVGFMPQSKAGSSKGEASSTFSVLPPRPFRARRVFFSR